MGKKHTRAMVIYNPHSGKGNADIEPALAVLRAEGWDLTICQKKHDGEGTRHAQKAVRNDYDVAIAAGGDGTVNDVMAGLRGSDVALGVLPIGTMNVWASEIGFAHRLDVVARQMLLAERHRVDVGRLEVNGEHSAHFLLLAGLGADAAVIDRTSRALKNRLGILAVGLATIESLPELRDVPVTVELDGMPWQGRTQQIIVGNSRRYGAFTNVTAGAYIDDGMLDVCIFTLESPLQLVRQAGSLVLRKRADPASAQIYRASSIVVRSEQVLPFEIDGSAADMRLHANGHGMEYRFTVGPGALVALVPRTYDGHLFRPTPLPLAYALSELASIHAGGRNHHNGRNGHAENGDGHAHGHEHGHQGDSHRMRVLAVGVDTVVAQKLKSGRVVTLEIGRHTRVEHRHGELAGLGRLAEGDIVRVKGKKTADGTIAAEQVALVERPVEATTL
jgi:YegS/Rv2252/BmrU family lipid kinase